jgi:hypothetical protein
MLLIAYSLAGTNITVRDWPCDVLVLVLAFLRDLAAFQGAGAGGGAGRVEDETARALTVLKV